MRSLVTNAPEAKIAVVVHFVAKAPTRVSERSAGFILSFYVGFFYW